MQQDRDAPLARGLSLLRPTYRRDVGVAEQHHTSAFAPSRLTYGSTQNATSEVSQLPENAASPSAY
jgi:hypothetical protein